MKFGKRLEAEAERRWLESYVDYKALKKAIKKDISEGDLGNAEFRCVISSELDKVDAFYNAQESFLEYRMGAFLEKGKEMKGSDSIEKELLDTFRELKSDVHELNKFVLLNYIAVVKAVKKRNRHMVSIAMEESDVLRMKPIQFLATRHFFTSLKLASMKTRLDVVEKGMPGMEAMSVDKAIEEYSCAICLNLLKSPVVLTCSHIYCWGCLVSLCSAVRRQEHHPSLDDVGKNEKAVWDCSDDEASSVATFNCPSCRREELLNLDRLVVDMHLEKYLLELESRQNNDGATPTVPMDVFEKSYLLPPQRPEYRDKLTLCLDLDGTLVTTFTPKRAPRLPDSAVSYVVGEGGKLNPAGVFVVERPGLGDFLRRAACLCEVVLFTAGLEDYAAPILNEIERRYGKVFAYRLYRPATTHSEVYPCVKDMSKLGRDINKCVLVDDTPLAFFRQPDLGIPVLQFRGDVDDRLLLEAVEPLVFSLMKEKNIPLALRRRFNMRHWFQLQGLDPSREMAQAKEATISLQRSASSTLPSQKDITGEIYSNILPSEMMLVMDFDKTITDWDAGERLTDEISPELTSLLSSVESPANFIPLTNTVLSEMHRRGVSRDKIINVLRGMGAEVPKGSILAIRWCVGSGIECRVLSDCNTIFINHILSAAKIKSCFTEVVTNPAAFERSEQKLTQDSTNSEWFFGDKIADPAETTNHKLIVSPKHDYGKLGHHGCPHCPENLCKGRELATMRANRRRKAKRVIFVGDGANDFCPALTLGRNDIILVRKGFSLEKLILNAKEKINAKVVFWEKHDELLNILKSENSHEY